MSLLVCLLSVVTASFAQQGQDYYFHSGGQEPRYLDFQQSSLQQNSQKQLPTFFAAQSSGVFNPFPTLSSQRALQNEYEPNKPLQFQLTPNQLSSLQNFENLQPRPTQFVLTNQHLPQSFQNFQDPSNSEGVPFRETGQSIRFQHLSPAQSPKYPYQLQDTFVDVHNSENDNGRTTQSYVNVQHPEGTANQISTTLRNRWKQVQTFTSPSEYFDSRRFKTPKVSSKNSKIQGDDLNLNTFVNLNLPNEGSLAKTSVSSSSSGDLSQNQERKHSYQNIRKKVLNEIQPVSGEVELTPKARKTLNFPRGTLAIPKTTENPELSTVSNFKITTLRSKHVNFRLPTTHIPFTNGVDTQLKVKDDNFPTNTESAEDIVDFRSSTEFNRLNLKNNNTSSIQRNKFKYLPDHFIPQHSNVDDGNEQKNHKITEEDSNEYEYSSDISGYISQFDNVYDDVKDKPISHINNKSNDSNSYSSIKQTESVKDGSNSSFDVLTMNDDHILVSDENFRGFVDSALIDITEQPNTEHAPNTIAVFNVTVSDENKLPSNKESSAIGNGSVNVYKTNTSSTENPIKINHNQLNAPPNSRESATNEGEYPTESWVIIASVQTSRSVSGARFLPGSVKEQDMLTSLLSKSSNSKNVSLGTTVPVNTSINSTYLSPKNISIKQSVTTHHPMSIVDNEYQTTGSNPIPSTESIIDKLDRVQSELSSGILSGRFRPNGNKLHLEVLPDMTTEKSKITSTKKNITATISPTTNHVPTTSSSVVIRKFTPNRSTTHRPKMTPKPVVTKKLPIFDNIQFDDLTGLLPPGFKARNAFTPKKNISTTTTTTKSISEMQMDEPIHFKNTLKNDHVMSIESSSHQVITSDVGSGLRSSTVHITSFNKTLKPKGLEGLLSNIQFQDVSALLPPGFKLNKTESITEEPKELRIQNIQTMLPSNLLPPGYKPVNDIKSKEGGNSDTNSTEENMHRTSSLFDSILKKGIVPEVSSYLPSGFRPSITLSSTQPTVNGMNNTSDGRLKVVFPSRPGGGRKAPARDSSRVKSSGGIGPVQPKIIKGWPTRATTEFTGWPTVPTTPISIEKILAAAKAVSVKAVTNSTTTSTSTTTTTTTTTPAPTTPGICSENCDLAATIKLISGAKWIPELLDHNTQEWQLLANQVHDQLESVYSSSESLSRWYKKITIDAFSEGSVLVDYFVELTDLGHTVNTADMRRLFHESLYEATVTQEALSGGDTLMAHNTTEYKMGVFVVDPRFTDFVVLPKQVIPTVGMVEDDVLLPQWAIAVIVIGLASLLFVIIFGVTVLVNRHNSAKKKQPIALTEDMLNELNKNHMGGVDNYGIDDLYNMEDVWNEKPTKKRSTGSLQENSMANLYDSWRSEWNGYYYNAYNGGAQNGSASGTSGYSRRKPDYDTNF